MYCLIIKNQKKKNNEKSSFEEEESEIEIETETPEPSEIAADYTERIPQARAREKDREIERI